MNQFIIWIAILIIGVFTAAAQNTIEVDMYNFDNNTGKAMIGLYDKPENFLKKEYKIKEATITDLKAHVIFKNIPDGTYAISLYHDEDDNKQLNMFLNFIPTEDYGSSNNAPARFWTTQVGRRQV